MVKKYRNYRKLLNQQIVMYDGTGDFDIPFVPAYHGDLPDGDKWIRFNQINQCKDPENTGVHFWLDDYIFERIWTYPQRYMEALKKFKCVAQPDFSMFRDFPKVLNMYNLFRNNWLANYWIDNGISVIPTPGWCDFESHEWSLETHEKGGIVAVSTVGFLFDDKDYEHFISGYNAMLQTLEPDLIVMHGTIPDDCGGNIIHIPSHTEKMHEGRENNGKWRRK